MIKAVEYIFAILTNAKHENNLDRKTNESSYLEIYRISVEMADRVSQRRQSANSFYLTLSTLIFGSSTYIKTEESNSIYAISISVSGILVSTLWHSSIQSYKSLNAAKFKVIHDLESNLPYQYYKKEWRLLDPDQDGVRHKQFHVTESAVPKIFFALHVIILIVSIPWSKIQELICRVI